MRKSKTVVVSGGTGFIGKHLIKKILKTNRYHRVIVLDNLYNSSWANFVKFLLEHRLYDHSSFDLSTSYRTREKPVKRMTFYRVDIRNREEIESVFEKEKEEGTDISACIHLAAKISVAESKLRPKETEEVNVHGTANVLECAKKIDIQHFVFASTAAVYGIPSKLPISELEAPRPISQYGESKLNAERIVAGYSKKNRRAISLRLFNVYGIGQTMEYAGVITKFADRIERNLPPVIYGNGHQTRDFVHVDDVVKALMKAAGLIDRQRNITDQLPKVMNGKYPQKDILIEAFPQQDLNSGVYNIGTGMPTKIKDLAHMMTNILVPNQYHRHKLKLSPIYLDAIDGDINKSYADIRRARYGLGFVPSISLRCGLENLLIQKKRNLVS